MVQVSMPIPSLPAMKKKKSLVFLVIWEEKATVKVIRYVTENTIMYLAYIVFPMFWPS